MSVSSPRQGPNSRDRYTSNLRWQFVANGAQAVFGGLYFIVLGRYLGASDFGLFAAVSAIVAVAGQLVEFRLQDLVAKDFCRIDDEKSPLTGDEGLRLIDLLILESLSRVVPILGLLLLAGVIVRGAQLPSQSNQLIFLAGAGFLLSRSGWGVSTGVLRVLGRTDTIAKTQLMDWGLRLVGTLVLVIAQDLNIHGAFVIAIAAGCTSNIFQVLLARREFERKLGNIPWKDWRLKNLPERTRGSRRLITANLGLSIADLMAKDLDVVMVSSILTMDKVGLYKMSKSVVQMLWRAVDPFYLAIMPEIQKLWSQKSYDQLTVLMKRTSVSLLLLSVLLIAIAFLTISEYGTVILGSNYSGLEWHLLIMSIWVVVGAMLIWGHPLAVAIGRPELAVGGSIVGSISGVVCFLILTPLIGTYGAAIASVVTLVSGFAFTAWFAVQFSSRMVSSSKLAAHDVHP